MGKRAHDYRAVPLCHQHHEDVQQYRDWPKEKLRVFLDHAAERCRAAYLDPGTEFPS